MPIDGEAVRVKILRCELAAGFGVPGTLLDDALTIARGDGAVRIVELQRAGKQPMKADVFPARYAALRRHCGWPDAPLQAHPRI